MKVTPKTPTTAPAPASDEPRTLLGLTVTGILAGAAASVTAALLGSKLGVAGTLAGAAVTSVVASTATAVYSAGLAKTHRGLRWALAVVATFGLALAVITTVESSTGRSFSGERGTTVARAAAPRAVTPVDDADPAEPAEPPASRAPATPEPTPSTPATPAPEPKPSTPAPATPAPSASATPAPATPDPAATPASH